MDMHEQKYLGRVVRGIYTRDNLMTFDQMTIDAAGSFLISQLEKIDLTLNEPLAMTTWLEDFFIRTDVSPADEIASFTNTAFASPGGLTGNGINWITNEGNANAGPNIDIGRTPQPMRLWGAEVKYTVPELVKSQKLGQPIDVQKIEAMNFKRNMDIDQLVYVGDTSVSSTFTGLYNSASVTPTTAAATGTGNATVWTSKTPQQVLTDIDNLLLATWQASGWKVFPNQLHLPPAQYAYLVSTPFSVANGASTTTGGVSLLTFILENNLSTKAGVKLEIKPRKFLIGLGVGGTPQVLGTVDRMVAWNDDKKYVQYPMTELQRTPLEYRSLFQVTTYWSRYGQTELRYAVTVGYMDGI